ncbi:hypothetical protein OKW32_002322 [Paraburkholderia youngii]
MAPVGRLFARDDATLDSPENEPVSRAFWQLGPGGIAAPTTALVYRSLTELRRLATLSLFASNSPHEPTSLRISEFRRSHCRRRKAQRHVSGDDRVSHCLLRRRGQIRFGRDGPTGTGREVAPDGSRPASRVGQAEAPTRLRTSSESLNPVEILAGAATHSGTSARASPMGCPRPPLSFLASPPRSPRSGDVPPPCLSRR